MNYYAKRGNKVLKISEDAVARYLGQGYNITDADGKVIKKGTPNDTNLLSAEYKKQQAEIDVLKNTNAKLTAELESAKAEVKKLKDELYKIKSSKPISETTEAPKTTRKRKPTTEMVESSEE